MLVTCGSCHRVLETGLAQPGGEVACPTCASVLRVPAPVARGQAPVRRCMSCGEAVPLSRRNCPACGKGYEAGVSERQGDLYERKNMWRKHGPGYALVQGGFLAALGVFGLVAPDAPTGARVSGLLMLVAGGTIAFFSARRIREVQRPPHGGRSSARDD